MTQDTPTFTFLTTEGMLRDLCGDDSITYDPAAALPKVWRAQYGRMIAISSMEDAHLQYAERFLRGYGEKPLPTYLQGTYHTAQYLMAFTAEMKRRGLAPLPEDLMETEVTMAPDEYFDKRTGQIKKRNPTPKKPTPRKI